MPILCRNLLQAACNLCGQPNDGCFEMSVGNPDKGVMPLEELRKRVQQFVKADIPLVVTHVSHPPFLTLQGVSVICHGSSIPGQNCPYPSVMVSGLCLTQCCFSNVVCLACMIRALPLGR